MIRRNRSTGGRLSLSKTRDSTSSDASSHVAFDDEENFITTILIALHDHILTNTASTGPAMDAKNFVWDLIRQRLCNRVNAQQRTDEQVSLFSHVFVLVWPLFSFVLLFLRFRACDKQFLMMISSINVRENALFLYCFGAQRFSALNHL